MHKYQPRVYIVKVEEGAPPVTRHYASIEDREYRTFIFPETSFIGVTAYQNQLVSINFHIVHIR